jgi:hypothetical protein
LLTIVAIPQWLSKQTRWDQIRARWKDWTAAAGAVNGDLHRQLLTTSNLGAESIEMWLSTLPDSKTGSESFSSRLYGLTALKRIFLS